jgi:hypothetical protein
MLPRTRDSARASLLTYDQRGETYPRVIGVSTDIGAFESTSLPSSGTMILVR